MRYCIRPLSPNVIHINYNFFYLFLLTFGELKSIKISDLKVVVLCYVMMILLILLKVDFDFEI
ncbi:hypothetical protein BpHYR1_040265 [Brachionus plicatilis]|uniref:Uncharacterized protein n=1 Tax=Brachionus plicatilis TaxID=10195 RepID=A0A3M7S250_BRAPC|nr:hypothetical protein BpHYR1_040265 [Brachionus plicatilis]